MACSALIGCYLFNTAAEDQATDQRFDHLEGVYSLVQFQGKCAAPYSVFVFGQ